MASVTQTVEPAVPLRKEPVMGKKLMVEKEDIAMASTASKKANRVVYGVYAVLILLGVGTGYLLSTSLQKGGLPGTQKTAIIQGDKVAGSTDTSTFKDTAEGVIEKGGVDGEGTHKLTREGGPSQTVALVSSILDLDEYVGKKVKVWGQTFPPQKAGWFMDIGKIEILE